MAKPSAAVLHAILSQSDKRSELYTVLKMCPPVLRAMSNCVPSYVFGLALVAWLHFLLT